MWRNVYVGFNLYSNDVYEFWYGISKRVSIFLFLVALNSSLRHIPENTHSMMPMVVVFVNTWRMWMRPALKVLSDICWACTRNLTIVHHRNDMTGANLPLDAILAVQPDIDFSKSAQNAYESTPIA